MDEKTQKEYDRLKNGPHSGRFTFLHHEGPVVERNNNIMERVEYILREKPPSEHYIRLRHICYVDTENMSDEQQALFRGVPDRSAPWEAYAKWQEAYAKWREVYAKWQEVYAKWQEAIMPYIIQLIPNCTWDGKTIFGKKEE